MMRNFILFFQLMIITATANAYDTDFGMWSGFFLNKSVDSTASLYLEAQTRIHEGANAVALRSNRFLVRPAVRFSLNEAMQIMVGYGWTPNFSPFRGENRIWQQLQVHAMRTSNWSQLYRIRTEQRWISYAEGTSIRVRLMARVDHWFDSQKSLGLTMWDEVFVATNSVTKGPQSGFDQNRLFIGPMIGFSNSARLECGYINSFVNPTAPSSKTIIHALGLFWFANL